MWASIFIFLGLYQQSHAYPDFIGYGYSTLSGMTQPQKVIGFLDVFGKWDMSLLFVMIGAVCVHSLSYFLIRHRRTPLLDTKWHLPMRKDLTGSLVGGAILFGFGWGLGGYCPGPAFASLAALDLRALVFVVGLLVGMKMYHKMAGAIPLRR